jgi:hypothetical protein
MKDSFEDVVQRAVDHIPTLKRYIRDARFAKNMALGAVSDGELDAESEMFEDIIAVLNAIKPLADGSHRIMAKQLDSA